MPERTLALAARAPCCTGSIAGPRPPRSFDARSARARRRGDPARPRDRARRARHALRRGGGFRTAGVRAGRRRARAGSRRGRPSRRCARAEPAERRSLSAPAPSRGRAPASSRPTSECNRAPAPDRARAEPSAAPTDPRSPPRETRLAGPRPTSPGSGRPRCGAASADEAARDGRRSTCPRRRRRRWPGRRRIRRSSLAEAAELFDAGDLAGAGDRMLTAVDGPSQRPAASTPLSTPASSSSRSAPGDPQVHLAIAQPPARPRLDALATEKIELLLRLTSLTGDTQAEADVHGLAAERLRDEPWPRRSRR